MPKLTDAVPVFLVDDIANTMQWYSTILGVEAHAVPSRLLMTSAF